MFLPSSVRSNGRLGAGMSPTSTVAAHWNCFPLPPSSWASCSRKPMFRETSLPGLFAAGDVRHNSVKRCAAAVGEGAAAVSWCIGSLH
jgi:hypothetical protein